MDTKLNHSGRHPVYLWNKDIAILRKECLRARRLHQRAVRGPLYAELTTSYEQKKKELKIAIKTAKRKYWQEFCEEVYKGTTVQNGYESNQTLKHKYSLFSNLS